MGGKKKGVNSCSIFFLLVFVVFFFVIVVDEDVMSVGCLGMAVVDKLLGQVKLLLKRAPPSNQSTDPIAVQISQAKILFKRCQCHPMRVPVNMRVARGKDRATGVRNSSYGSARESNS